MTVAEPLTGPIPTLFLSHGSPMIALEPGEAGRFMQRLGPVMTSLWGLPRGIVIMSPHTATRTPFVLGATSHDTVHDFGGFPPALNEIRYDAPGAPELAEQVTQLLQAGQVPAQLTEQGGLDHGIWTVLMHMYPQSGVPVVPVSLSPQATPADMMALGRTLRSLAHEQVLVLGSGSLTHNLRRFFQRPTPVDAPEEADCAAFRGWVAQHAEAADWPSLLDYHAHAPHAVAMHPTDEHWLPFYFAAGAAGDDDVHKATQAVRLHGSVTHGHLAMDAYAFGPQAGRLREALG